MKKVNLSRIPADKKREAWERLKQEYPDQAAWVQDPFVQALCADFIDEETGETVNFNPELIIYIPEEGDEKQFD